MPVLTSVLNNLSNFLQDHHVSFSNGILILLTVGGEQIFKLGDFKCPCTQPQAWYYAFVFFLVPAIVLGIMGWAVSNLTWRVLHGCCRRSKDSANGSMKVISCVLAVLARSAVVPVAWLFLMFLDGNYFACMKSDKPCDADKTQYISWKFKSQIIGWCILLGAVAISFIVISIVRCCDSVTYDQYKYINAYREAEDDQFNGIAKDHTNVLAKDNVNKFITHTTLSKEDWDAVSVAPELCYSWPPLSPLHKWASEINEPVP